MKIGIIAAMPEELAYLVQHLENAQEQVVLGNTYHTGTIASHEVVLVESGIGKVMSAMSVAILADHFQVDALINTGSAGAVAEGIAVGDVVIADKLAYHDVDLAGLKLGQVDLALADLVLPCDGQSHFLHHLGVELGNDLIGVVLLAADDDRATGVAPRGLVDGEGIGVGAGAEGGQSAQCADTGQQAASRQLSPGARGGACVHADSFRCFRAPGGVTAH